MVNENCGVNWDRGLDHQRNLHLVDCISVILGCIHTLLAPFLGLYRAIALALILGLSLSLSLGLFLGLSLGLFIGLSLGLFRGSLSLTRRRILPLQPIILAELAKLPAIICLVQVCGYRPTYELFEDGAWHNTEPPLQQWAVKG